jgi:exopolyphosphatase/guanosine-5'-triphosphate,3'-diphosphate pyrophosphatase
VSAIIPRWEWRAFGDAVDALEPVLDDVAPDRVHESDEVYLLSVDGTDAVKVRDELMDVKHLVRVSDEGLEQWVPVMKAAFPLSVADVGAALGALRVDIPASLPRDAYTFPELLAELVDPNPGLLAVEVHKRRERYTIGGCLAELTEVRTANASTRTFAIESEDADLVLAAVRAVGMAPRPNVSFARGLKALVGFGRERYAVIDVGTNSVKFHVGERSTDGHWHTVVDRAEVTRLGDGLHETGRINAEPMERTVEAIAGMVEDAGRHDVSAIASAGTAGLRIAPNSADFVEAVRTRCGVAVQIISGEDEARLAYLAAVAGLGHAPGTSVVFDTGGGSSQFTFGHGAEVVERFSVDVGAVRFTERYALDAAVSPDVLAEALAAIASELGRLDGRPVPESLAGMGGAVTNLAAVSHGLAEYDPEVVQGTVLDRTELDRQIELYRTRTADERRAIVGLQPQRADIILAGACIVRTVLDKLGKDSLTVSDRGLRHGVLAERFGSGPVSGGRRTRR